MCAEKSKEMAGGAGQAPLVFLLLLLAAAPLGVAGYGCTQGLGKLLSRGPGSNNIIVGSSALNDTIWGDMVGSSVSISGDGSVALVGASGYANRRGTARAYRWDAASSQWVGKGTSDLAIAGFRSNSVIPQAGELIGESVSLSSDGSVALVSASGWVGDGHFGTARAYRWDPAVSEWVR